VLALDQAAPFDVSPADILGHGAAAAPAAEYRVWEYWHGVAASAPCNDSHPYTIAPPPRSADAAVITSVYLVLSPVLPSGWTFLGEAAKIVAASARRVRAIEHRADGFAACLEGSAGEVIGIAARSPDGALHTLECTAASDGAAAAVCTAGGCSCEPSC
jgi:hypothetical protein